MNDYIRSQVVQPKPLNPLFGDTESEDGGPIYEILDSNGNSKSDRERLEKKKQKKKRKMTRTHKIV